MSDPASPTINRPFDSWKQVSPSWQNEPLPESLDVLRIAVITWNMKGKPPPEDVSDIILKPALHHIYVICTQECMRPIAFSVIYSSMILWEQTITKELGDDYKFIGGESLGGTHMMLIVHKSIIHLCSQPRIDTVSTGFFNIIPNKGAVGICFNVKNTSLLLIGSHLASGEGCVTDRNESFNRIESELELGDYKEALASNRFDCAFFLGDMNYRIKASALFVNGLILNQEKFALLKKDELIYEMSEGRVAYGFKEGLITFPPTFKYKGNEYVLKRIPSWTDRILFKAKTDILKQQTYGYIPYNVYSDHKPVFSQFTIQV